MLIYVSEEHNIVLTMSVRNVHLQSFPAISESTFVDVTARHWMISCSPSRLWTSSILDLCDIPDSFGIL